MVSKVSYIPLPVSDPLEDLVSEARVHLRNEQVKLLYPEALKRRHEIAEWRIRVNEICQLNEELLTEITNCAGVYAIWGTPTISTNAEWELKYIGQTMAEASKQRIKAHLIWRNKETKSGRYTGSMFDNVRALVRRRKDVALSFVEVDPEALRHFVESRLIRKFHPMWNSHGTNPLKQQSLRLRFM